ncbi:MAG: AprI/Inh family metalloprotease inhibitor [Variibacter sp.]
MKSRTPAAARAGSGTGRSGSDTGWARSRASGGIRVGGVLAALLSMAACVSNGTPTTTNLTSSHSATGPGVASSDLAGRWTLSSSAGGACAMTFVAGAGSDGAVQPEGGCPGKFFTSRKWSIEGGAIVIRNHNNEPLARLTAISPTRYEGQSASGQQLSLVR